MMDSQHKARMLPIFQMRRRNFGRHDYIGLRTDVGRNEQLDTLPELRSP